MPTVSETVKWPPYQTNMLTHVLCNQQMCAKQIIGIYFYIYVRAIMVAHVIKERVRLHGDLK